MASDAVTAARAIEDIDIEIGIVPLDDRTLRRPFVSLAVAGSRWQSLAIAGNRRPDPRVLPTPSPRQCGVLYTAQCPCNALGVLVAVAAAAAAIVVVVCVRFSPQVPPTGKQPSAPVVVAVVAEELANLPRTTRSRESIACSHT